MCCDKRRRKKKRQKRKRRIRWAVKTGGSGRAAALTCIVAQALSLLSPPVDPDADAHEDDPAGATDPGDESRLLHHIGDLLGDAVVPVPVNDHIAKLFAFKSQERREKTIRIRQNVFLQNGLTIKTKQNV